MGENWQNGKGAEGLAVSSMTMEFSRFFAFGLHIPLCLRRLRKDGGGNGHSSRLAYPFLLLSCFLLFASQTGLLHSCKVGVGVLSACGYGLGWARLGAAGYLYVMILEL